MDESQANILFIEQLKRELVEALEVNEQLKASEQYWIARAKKAESQRDGKLVCRL